MEYYQLQWTRDTPGYTQTYIEYYETVDTVDGPRQERRWLDLHNGILTVPIDRSAGESIGARLQQLEQVGFTGRLFPSTITRVPGLFPSDITAVYHTKIIEPTEESTV
jgi:hypothetical protein